MKVSEEIYSFKKVTITLESLEELALMTKLYGNISLRSIQGIGLKETDSLGQYAKLRELLNKNSPDLYHTLGDFNITATSHEA